MKRDPGSGLPISVVGGFEGDINLYDNAKSKRSSLSCFRKWKSMTSLQRQFLALLIILGVLGGYLVLHTRPTKTPAVKNGFPALNSDLLDANNLNELKGVDTHPKSHRRKPRKRGELRNPHPVVDDTVPDMKDKFLGSNEKSNEKGDDIDHFKGPQNERQRAVVGAMRHAWGAYKKHAWGHDMLLPQTGGTEEWFNLGLTLIDSLDTLYIMGLKDEFNEAREWVAHSLRLDGNTYVNLFEVTIRVLGGLLSTYRLTGDDMFKDKAHDLGDRLMPAFDTPTGVPKSDVNLGTRHAKDPAWGDSSTSEAATLQLEFTELTYVTGDDKYKAAADRVTDHIHKLDKMDGLVPIYINAHTGRFRPGSHVTLGARGDSYYEYLLKQWVHTGRKKDTLKEDYVAAVEGVKKHLVRETGPKHLTFIGELLGGRTFSPKMDHLVCFMTGTLAMGTHFGLPEDHMDLARKLIVTNYEMYEQMPTKLSPEIVYFNMQKDAQKDITVKPLDRHNLLRPEAVEALFYMYRFTKDEKYREWGWKIFQAFEKYTKVPEGGYTSINNVMDPRNVAPRNKMESFFLGETLKYFYLLFSDDDKLLSLDEWVFNTEAHPFPIHRN